MKDIICQILVRTGALRFGAFTLPTGRFTCYHMDLAILPAFPEIFDIVTGIYETTVKKEVGADRFERIGCPLKVGIPYGPVLALRTMKPFLYIRKGADTHGRERKVEGLLLLGERVLIVDDITTTGKSILEATDMVRCEGGVVNDAVVLIDREEGGPRALEAAGVKLHAFVNITEIAKTLFGMGSIDNRQFEEIMKQKTRARAVLPRSQSQDVEQLSRRF